MITLNFSVDDQLLTRTDENTVAANSHLMHVCEFAFSSEWDGRGKVATFKKRDLMLSVILEDDACTIPPEILQSENKIDVFELSVCGADGNSTITSTVVKVPILAGTWDVMSTEITPTMFEQIMKKIDEVKKGEVEPELILETVNEYFNEHPIDDVVVDEVAEYITEHTAELKGEKGDKGDKGEQGEQGIQGIQGIQGEKGEKGAKGDKGDSGTNGKSAYEIAVDEGFQGTEEEWLESLQASVDPALITQVTELQYSSDYLDKSKLEKEKEYTEIVGTTTQGLWNVRKSAADAFSNYNYSVYDTGFSSGDYVSLKGFQVVSVDSYPVAMFYDTNMNLLLSVTSSANTMVTKEMFVPKNTAYIYINGHKTGNATPTLKQISFADVAIATQADIEYVDDVKLNKQKLYTDIEGTLISGLWKVNKITDASSNYTYKIITSGFNVGERIAITGFQPSSYRAYPLCIFYDDNMNQVGIVNPDKANTGFVKYEAIIPDGTTQFYINGLSARSSTTKAAAYSVDYSTQTIDGMVVPLNYAVQNWMERRYRDGEYLQFAQKALDHAVVTFSIDDSFSDVSTASDLFISKGVPLCLATIPSKLDYMCDNGDTVLQTCIKTVNNGGEILTHNGSVIDANTTAQGYYDYFVTAKQTLENVGFKVRGIIKAGGGTDDPNIETTLTYLRSYYDYGTGFQYVTDRRYNTGRISMASMSLNELKLQVDSISNGGIINFYTHGSNDMGNDWITKISDLIDYIQSINGAEIVTIGEMFLNNYVPSFKS